MQRSEHGRRWSSGSERGGGSIMKVNERAEEGQDTRWPILEPPRQRDGKPRANLPHREVDVIFTSITVTCHRGTDLAPVTALRVVRGRGLDYTRLTETELLVR